MFDGSEQFHQFIASSRTSLPISLQPFPLHGNPSTFSAAFDHYAPPLHHHHPSAAAAAKTNLAVVVDSSPKHNPLISTNLALESLRSTDPWSNDELLALLKLRSTMELWFPDFTWEHVSRKLGELGFKRSGEQCKEKFEEESRHFNINSSSKNNYRILSELDEFYNADDDGQDVQAPASSAGRSRGEMEQAEEVVEQEKMQMKKVEVEEEEEENPSHREEIMAKKASKKRKREDKFEMVKGFCESVVKTMMAKQEELHDKLIADIVRRDEEKIAREEAWKNREMDRIRSEIEIRSKEQKSAAERQATIIEFLKHFTNFSDHHQQQHHHLKNKIDDNNNNNNNNNSNSSNSNSNSSANSFPQTTDHDAATPRPSMMYQKPPPPPSPNNSSILAAVSNTPPPPPSGGGDDVGKRWPRDEVVALINLRCKMSGGGEGESKEGAAAKGPLWERISQGMKEMGYNRSAKRCKEKWENINKYFRKTKDSSKKRSLNSRTCPYFHHLTSLYSDGTIVVPTAAAAAPPENLQPPPPL